MKTRRNVFIVTITAMLTFGSMAVFTGKHMWKAHHANMEHDCSSDSAPPTSEVTTNAAD